MPAYLIVEISIHDDAWTAEYRQHVPAMIAAAGGRYLAELQAAERIEGQGNLPQFIALTEFPSAEVARQLMASAAYAPFAKLRKAGADTTIYLADGCAPT